MTAAAPRPEVVLAPGAAPRAARLREAIEFACAHETPWPREPGGAWGIHEADPPPFNRLRGPVHGRGPVSGVIWQGGEELASWGEPERADLTFSVAKTYLALLAGIAQARGLLGEVDEPVARRAPGIGFDDERNRTITWEQLLQQTSEWQGSCFGIPEQVDRYRWLQYQPGTAQGRKGDARPLGAPGSVWEYNDVRINQLSLALLQLFRRPLPEVFEEAVLRPAGARGAWRWTGYDDAWVEIDGRRMQSVPGGSHWGGGVSIGARDQARIAQALLDGACARRGHDIVPAHWLRAMTTPCPIAPYYGYLVWLNGTRQLFPGASPESWYAIGAGSSLVAVDPAHDSVAVVRWIDAPHSNGFLARLAAALA